MKFVLIVIECPDHILLTIKVAEIGHRRKDIFQSGERLRQTGRGAAGKR